MKAFIVLLALFVAVSCQGSPRSEEQPHPYSFNYVAEGEEGKSSHQEEGDGQGNVRGSYEVVDADGRNRVVEYQAGPEGFRAVVRTNEPGTSNHNPADVIMESTAETANLYQAEGRAQPPRAQPAARREIPIPMRRQN